MLFNPIFINPQKFLSTPETGGVKQNKLSYLFSDIIKNSLGVKKQSNESESAKLSTSNIVSPKSSDESIKVNTAIELTEADKKIIDDLNSILSAFGKSSVKTEMKTETVKIENTDHEEIEISSDDEAITILLSGLLNLAEKNNLQITASKTGLQKNLVTDLSSGDFKNILPELKKIINQLDPDKQLQITIKVGGKNIDLNIAKSNSDIKVTNPAQKLSKPKVENSIVENLIHTDEAEDIRSNMAKPSAETTKSNDKTVIENKDQLTELTNKAASRKVDASIKNSNEKLKPSDVVGVQNKSAAVLENKNTDNTIVQKFKLDIKISKAVQTIPDVVLKSATNTEVEPQNKLSDLSRSTISFNVDKVPTEKSTLKSAAEIKPISDSKITVTAANTPSSKLIQSIRKIDNNMLRQDIVPSQIKFNPVAVDEIKNQKFDLLNLSSAVRTIKSLNKPIDEQVERSMFKLNTKNSISRNDVQSTTKDLNVTPSSHSKFSVVDKIESVSEVLTKPVNEIKSKTENELRASSKEILTAIKTGNKTVEITRLQEFLSSQKNEKLSIRILPAETEVKLSNEIIAKPNKSVKLAEGETAKPIRQKEFTGKQFEIDFEKFEKAVKDKSGSKNIREFIASNDKTEKTKIVIEPLKTHAADKASVKINEAAKAISEENVKVIQNNSTGKEELLSKTAPKVNDVQSSEPQKEIKVETNTGTENKTASSNNGSSKDNQSAQNNFSKPAVVESDKYQTVNNSDNFSEELKNINVAKPAETVPTGQTNELSGTAKQMPETFRDVKAADIYKELYKIIEKKEHQSITLQVIPKKLGRVKVVVDIVDQMVQTKIEVENESAKQLLQNNMDALKQSLSQSGIQLSNYSVSLSSSNNKTYKPFNSKKKETGNDEPENTDNENMPISGKKMGYNTYEYLI